MGRANLVGVPICVVNYRIVSVLRVQVLESCAAGDGYGRSQIAHTWVDAIP